MAEGRSCPSVGDRIEIELDKAGSVSAHVLWARDGRFGARFETSLPFEVMWAPSTPWRRPKGPSPQPTDRVAVDVPVTTWLNGNRCLGRIRNVSTRGMMIETTAPLKAGRTIEIGIEDWPVLPGTVKWSGGGRAGIRLDRPLSEEQRFSLIVPR